MTLAAIFYRECSQANRFLDRTKGTRLMDHMEETLWNYRVAAIEAQNPDLAKANEWSVKLHDCYKTLRRTEEGRKGILSLLIDNNPYVRLWAGAHVLEWAPDVGRPVLEKLRDEDGPGAFDAKWILIEHDKGLLAFDR